MKIMLPKRTHRLKGPAVSGTSALTTCFCMFTSQRDSIRLQPKAQFLPAGQEHSLPVPAPLGHLLERINQRFVGLCSLLSALPVGLFANRDHDVVGTKSNPALHAVAP